MYSVIAILFMVNLNAQTFGIKGGLNGSNYTGSGYSWRTSIHVGLVSEFIVNDKFSFQPELLFSSQGSTFSDEIETDTYILNYLNVPLIAKYYVINGFSIEAGPQIGLLLSAKNKYTVYGSESTEDIKDTMKSIDFGLNLGLGYKLGNGLNFGARYIMGLVSADKGYSGSDGKNEVIQISVGYFFK